MGLLHHLTLRRAAKRYARELPGRLLQAYGATTRFDPAQIRAAASSLSLDSRFIAFGYAAVLSEEEFIALQGEMPIPMAYHDARSQLARFAPRGAASEVGLAGDSYRAEAASSETDVGPH
jgi:hypothetical protein